MIIINIEGVLIWGSGVVLNQHALTHLILVAITLAAESTQARET